MVSTSRSKCKVLIVDDEPLCRCGLRRIIEADPTLEVCAEADSVAMASAAVEKTNPDLIVLDICLEGNRGVEFIRQISERSHAKVLVCSRRDESIHAERCLHAGAQGYLSKRTSAEKLCRAMHDALEGKLCVSPGVSERVLSRMARGKGPVAAIESLTDRELEILDLLGRGVTTREIGQRLHLSMKTVQSYCQTIKSKLDANNNNELIRRAVYWVLTGE